MEEANDPKYWKDGKYVGPSAFDTTISPTTPEIPANLSTTPLGASGVNALFKQYYGRDATQEELNYWTTKSDADLRPKLIPNSAVELKRNETTISPDNEKKDAGTGWYDQVTGKDTQVGVGTPRLKEITGEKNKWGDPIGTRYPAVEGPGNPAWEARQNIRTNLPAALPESTWGGTGSKPFLPSGNIPDSNWGEKTPGTNLPANLPKDAGTGWYDQVTGKDTPTGVGTPSPTKKPKTNLPAYPNLSPTLY